jgi:hypothetical protein
MASTFNNKPNEDYLIKKQAELMAESLKIHLGMVFHRFLENKVRGKRLAIYINENKVTHWDPFVADEPRRKALEPISLRVEGHGGRSDVFFEPYVLPAQSMFSTPEAHKRASGPNQWNRQQGFYIYRADRLIQSGGWSNIRTLDEHLKLSRIAVDFSPRLDEEFKINIPKMKVAFPAEIRAQVEKLVKLWTKVADDTYRQANRGGGTPLPVSSSLRTPSKSISAVPASSGALGLARAAAAPSNVGITSPGFGEMAVTLGELTRVGKLLKLVAKPDEIPAIDAAVARAQSTLKD